MNLIAGQPAPLLPPPPRALTGAIRKRCWAEPLARFFLLAALVCTAVAIAFFVLGYSSWRRERDLIARSVPVDARIAVVTYISRPGFSADPTSPVTLEFTWNNAPYRTRRQHPLEGYDRFVTVGDTVRLHVDPNDPELWTTLDHPSSLRDRVMGAILLIPAIGVFIFLLMVRRTAVLGLWRHGLVTPSIVLRTTVSPLAPLGRAVRCTPTGEEDDRVFTVYLRGGQPQPGDLIDVLAMPMPSNRAAAMEFFS